MGTGGVFRRHDGILGGGVLFPPWFIDFLSKKWMSKARGTICWMGF